MLSEMGKTPKERELYFRKEKIARYAEMEKCLRRYFLLLIANIIFGVISAFCSAVIVGPYWDTPAGGTGFHVMTIVIGIISASICGAAVYHIFRMNRLYDGFNTSGVFYTVQIVLSFIQLFVVDSPGAYLFFQGSAAVASILFSINFASNMTGVFDMTDAYQSEKWASFKKTYTGLLIATFVAVGMCIIPGFAILGLIAIVLICIGTVGVMIWFIVLIYQSAESFKIVGAREAKEIAKEENAALA